MLQRVALCGSRLLNFHVFEFSLRATSLLTLRWSLSLSFKRNGPHRPAQGPATRPRPRPLVNHISLTTDWFRDGQWTQARPMRAMLRTSIKSQERAALFLEGLLSQFSRFWNGRWPPCHHLMRALLRMKPEQREAQQRQRAAAS